MIVGVVRVSETGHVFVVFATYEDVSQSHCDDSLYDVIVPGLPPVT